MVDRIAVLIFQNYQFILFDLTYLDFSQQWNRVRWPHSLPPKELYLREEREEEKEKKKTWR